MVAVEAMEVVETGGMLGEVGGGNMGVTRRLAC